MPKDRSRKNVSARAKRLEKRFAKFLCDHGIEAERVNRVLDYGKSDTDVKVKDFPELKIDTKSQQESAHWTLFERDVIGRYKKAKTDKAIMPVGLKGKKGMIVTIEAEFFVELLALWINNEKFNRSLSKEDKDWLVEKVVEAYDREHPKVLPELKKLMTEPSVFDKSKYCKDGEDE